MVPFSGILHGNKLIAMFLLWLALCCGCAAGASAGTAHAEDMDAFAYGDWIENADNLFTEFDANGDGQLSYAEVHQTFRGIGMFTRPGDFQMQWVAMDADGNQMVSGSEFRRVLEDDVLLLPLV